ncbi:SPOR domain-containing protein [Ningiella sp. W23]|uniref:SPOR domain-containing protein n=1 Tax=Ningiella sp. W23 TaxID=3023715 RepID=UPI00375774CB
MAQTDYVSRGQKKKKKAPEPAPKPWLRILISLVLVCSFVFGLYFLQNARTHNSPSSEEQPNALTESTDASEVSSTATANRDAQDIEVVKPETGYLDKDPLPELGEEEWAFIDSLPAYSVEVDVPEEVDSNRIYIMPCGSFRAMERAETLRAQLALAGLIGETVQSDGENGRWYRVVLGPYESKRRAERDRHQARRADVNTCKIY